MTQVTTRKITLIAIVLSSLRPNPCLALPPENELSEEILRSEIILEGRSPIDGKALSAAQYEQLQAELAQTPFSPQIDSNIRQLIFLLQIRKLIKTIIPFI